MKTTEEEYLKHIKEIIFLYKHENKKGAQKVYKDFFEGEDIKFPAIFSLILNIEYILDDNYTLMSKDNLLEEVTEEYLKIKQQLLSEESGNVNMYRKGISALIINRNKEFLLVNLKSFEDKYFAIPGGGVENAETLEEATYREIEEELGITANSLELVGKSRTPLIFKFKTIKMTRGGVEYVGSERNFFGFNFIGNEDEIKLQESEVRAHKWVPFIDLNKYLLFDNQLEESTEKILEIFSFFG